MSPMQRCFSDLVCQSLVTSWVIDAYLCLAMLHAWTLEYQQILRLMVDIYEGRKSMVSWRRQPGRLRNVWRNKIQADANALLLSMLWRSEIAMGHRAARSLNEPFRLRDDDDGDDDEG